MSSAANDRKRERYANDPEYRDHVLANQRAWHARNPEKAAAQRRRWYEKHRTEVIADNKRYYSENRLLVRARTARRLYGVSVEDFIALYETSTGLCAICGRPETKVIRGLPQPLAFDHSHTTGKARGFLCADCNTGLGLFGDTPSRLRAAADYLEAAA